MTPALQSSNAPEKQLLVLCARTRISAENAAEITALLSRSLDWDLFVSESLENSVTPLVIRTLRAHGWPAVPAEWQARFNDMERRIAMRGMMLTAELLRLLDAFATRGVRAIPYKGPVLAAQAYGDYSRHAMIELHTERTLRHFPVAPDIDAFLANRVPVRLADHEVLTFAHE